jgi:tetratricopeptide (TPR) repeat protein
VAEKLQAERQLSIWGGNSNSDAASLVQHYLDTRKDFYNVVLWIQADSVVRVTAQYMELAAYLRLRASNATGPESVSRLLTWLYRQKSYLLVFETSNKATKIDVLEPFIPHGWHLMENKQTGHVIFLSHQQKLYPNHLRIDYASLPETQSAMAKVVLESHPTIRDLVVSFFKLPSVASIDVMLMLQGGVSSLSSDVAARKLNELSDDLHKLQKPSTTNITREIGKWTLQFAQLSEFDSNLIQLLSLPTDGQLSLKVIRVWAALQNRLNVDPSIKSLVGAGICQSLAVDGRDEVVKLFRGVMLSVAEQSLPEKRVALGLELLVALASFWPTIGGNAPMPFRAPQFVWADEIEVNKTSVKDSVQWARQYYSSLFFTLYLSHTHEAKIFPSMSSMLNLVVDIAVRGQTEIVSLTTPTAKTELLQKALALSKIDGRFAVQILAQAGHCLLGVHGLTKDASRVFGFRLALSQTLEDKLTPLLTPLTGDELAVAYRDMAIVLSSTKRFHDAFEHLEQALQLVTKRHSADHVVVALLNAEKGDIFLAQASTGSANNSSQLAAARSFYEKSMSMLGPGLFRAVGYHRLAVLFEFVGESPNSILNHEKALEIENTELGSYHVGVVHRLDIMGESWRKLSRSHEALRVDSKALQIAKEISDSLDPWFGKHLAVVGLATAQLNSTKDRSSELPSRRALKNLEQALNIETEAAGENHPLVSQRLRDFADLHATLGSHDKALVYYRRAYNVEVTLKGFQDPLVFSLRQSMELTSKRIQEAKALLDKSKKKSQKSEV